MINGNDRDTSEFNMAVGYLNRLNSLFYLADEAAMSLKVDNWLHTLLTLCRELSTEMRDEEIEEIMKDFNKINYFVQKSVEYTERTGKIQVSNETYNSLHYMELKLRKILKESGLQMKMKQGAGLALE